METSTSQSSLNHSSSYSLRSQKKSTQSTNVPSLLNPSASRPSDSTSNQPLRSPHSFSQRHTRSTSEARHKPYSPPPPQAEKILNFLLLERADDPQDQTSRLRFSSSEFERLMVDDLLRKLNNKHSTKTHSVRLFLKTSGPLKLLHLLEILNNNDRFEELVESFIDTAAISVMPVKEAYPKEPEPGEVIFGIKLIPRPPKLKLSNALKEDRYAAIKQDVGSPSTAARTSTYYKSQWRESTAIYDGRLGSTYSRVPVSIDLYHPIFSFFVMSCETAHSSAYNATYVQDVRALSDQVLLLNELPEPEINDKLRPLLAKVIGDVVSVVKFGNAIPDGATADGTFIFEFKKEMAESCDPHKQSAYSMRQRALETRDTPRADTCCPTFLISAAGPFWTISGSVFTDKLIVQHLTPTFWLGSKHNDDSRGVLQAARYFRALKGSLERLRFSQYRYLAVKPPQPTFPYPRTFKLNQTEEVTFQYVDYLQPGTSLCQTFLAKGDISGVERTFVVKFVSRYCPTVHEFLAGKKYAPDLLFFGRLPEASVVAEPGPQEYLPGVAGEIKHMVVMEYIKGTLVEDFVANSKPIPEDVLTGIRDVLEALHMEGYAFGDLRPPNVIFTEDKRVKFIDFNWSGSYEMSVARSITSNDIPEKIRDHIKNNTGAPTAPLYPVTTSPYTHYPWNIIKAFGPEKDLTAITPATDWDLYERLFKGYNADPKGKRAVR